MAGSNFDTSNQSYRMITGNGIQFQVPLFQRNYSWEEEQWDDLWLDIMAIYRDQEEEEHYMGYLVLQTSDNRNYLVVDGQQRLTTISLIILAGLQIIQELVDGNSNREENEQRFDLLKKQYIGRTDPVSLVSSSKLILNRHNNDYFQNHIIPMRQHHVRGLSASNKLMKQAFEYYYKQIRTEIGMDGLKITTFIEKIADILLFTKISVSDQLNAFKVFETLNARGVKLSATDLLKNYFFSIVNNEQENNIELDQLDKRWNKLIETLGSESFPEFLRIYWNSTHKIVRKTNLFKTIRKSVIDRNGVYSLIEQMEEYSGIYLALNDPSDELWDKEQSRQINLLKMFNVKQPQVFLLAAYFKLSKGEYTDLLRYTVVLSFRYNVICRLHAGEQEEHYNKLALDISTSPSDLKKIKKWLLHIYPDDVTFYHEFCNKELKTTYSRNKKIVKYILCQLEMNLENKELDYESEEISIEHILPENPSDNWEDNEEFNSDKNKYRLGNYTLLEIKKNRNAGNDSFDEKLLSYEKSSYKITQRLAKLYTDWNMEAIERNQKSMAQSAKTIWKIN
ncbi:MAG: DUF262 domain-containing HNH endonuclease family protein [Candidatus Cloacimonetes bacterium]|nr:DUF262 domain-containing HNH endonuclease family protein [Candidatus Cloacimonadota bacterium]